MLPRPRLTVHGNLALVEEPTWDEELPDEIHEVGDPEPSPEESLRAKWASGDAKALRQVAVVEGERVECDVITGKQHDPNTGLVYFGARYYDPEVGRFLTQDTYLGEPNTPPSLHRYLYAYSNPTVFIDRRGNLAESVESNWPTQTGRPISGSDDALEEEGRSGRADAGDQEKRQEETGVTVDSMSGSKEFKVAAGQTDFNAVQNDFREKKRAEENAARARRIAANVERALQNVPDWVRNTRDFKNAVPIVDDHDEIVGWSLYGREVYSADFTRKVYQTDAITPVYPLIEIALLRGLGKVGQEASEGAIRGAARAVGMLRRGVVRLRSLRTAAREALEVRSVAAAGGRVEVGTAVEVSAPRTAQAAAGGVPAQEAGTASGGLSNAEVRKWYSGRVKKLDTSGPLTQETAARVHASRNALKAEARVRMADRATAAELERAQPLRPFEYYVEKYTKQGYSGEALWERIIQGGTKPNAGFDAAHGVK